MSVEAEVDSKSKVIADALSELKALSQPKHYITLKDANLQGYVTLEQYSDDAYKEGEKPPGATVSKEFRGMYLDSKLDRVAIKDGKYVKWGYRVRKP